MNRIEKKFRDLKRQNKKAFIAYICCGDPDLNTTQNLVKELAREGVDLVELGMPFSDPLADGPTIQEASQRALKNKINLRSIFKMVKDLRIEVNLPLVIMSYYNPIFRYGIRRFVREAKASGLDGVIVPDLPPEEAGPLRPIAEESEFYTIFLAAPTSTAERLKLIVSSCRGFVYYVSLTGVTGAREKLPRKIIDDVKKIKRLTKKPVCVGFGVSRPSQVREITRVADGVVVGSAIIEVIEKNIGRPQLVKKVGEFVRKLVEAT